LLFIRAKFGIQKYFFLQGFIIASKMAAKDAIQVVIDCSKAMFDFHPQFEGKRYIETAIDSVKMLMQQRLLYGSPQDQLGIILYGYDDSTEEVVYRPIEKLDLGSIRGFVEDMRNPKQ
jgi:hypothetical protein